MIIQDKLDSKNQIIRIISDKTYLEIESDLEMVKMPLGQMLHRAWSKIDYVYFPETSVISVVSVLENGNGVESGIVGKEGVLGAVSVFAGEMSFAEATTQLGGEGWRMEILKFKQIFDNNEEFRNVVLSYMFSFIAQITQNAVCLCYHTIDKRLARCLLMFNDRADKEKLVLTQEFIAQMLGVHRPSVSKNANKLQNMNLISYVRGVVRILDRQGLESYACECYQTLDLVSKFCAANNGSASERRK